MLRPYLTIEELAAELGISVTAARALVDEGKLPAIQPHPGRVLISRLALDAYRRRMAGEATPVPPITFVKRSPEQVRAAFEAQTGMTPADWERRWRADEIEDSAENMALSFDALWLAECESGGRGPQTASRRSTDSSRHDDVVAAIDAEEFEAAQRDPRVRAFLKRADDYLDELEREGRNH